MSHTVTIREGYDTWVSSSAPTSKHPRDNRLRVQSTSVYGYLYFPLGPELRNVTILSATLYLYGRGTAWGSQTVTVKSITQIWDAATLTWNHKPSVGSTSVTRTQGNADDLTEWPVDVTALVQEYASGSRWRGMRLSIGDTTERRFNSLNAASKRPRLVVEWTEAPAAPVDLSPAGGRAVSTSRPVLSWSNENSPEGDNLTAIQVQVDPAANGTTPGFDSGTVTSTLAELDLSQTAYAGLSNAATTQWRVRVRDEDGAWSAWSDWATFTRVDKGTVTITTPGSTVAEYTPPVAWTTTFTQTAWQLLILDADDTSEVLHDTGRKTGTTQDYTIPAKDSDTGRRILVDGRDYVLKVRAWDGVDREATSGDPSFASASVVFTYADDPTPNPVTSLVATQVTDTPYVDLTWERATTPDGWTILCNDKVAETNIDGADLLVSGTSYTYRFKDAKPGENTFKVKPTVNGLTAGSPTATIITTSTGIWILGPDDIDVLIGVYDDDSYGSFAMPDRATTFDLPESRQPVRITQGVTGLRGDIKGALQTWSGHTSDVWADRLLTLKKQYRDPVTLYIGEEVLRAVIFDIVIEPPDYNDIRRVSFSFFQVGAIDWLDD